MSSSQIFKAIYKKVLLIESEKPEELCCICLQAVEKGAGWIYDEVHFEMSTNTVVETLGHILETLIGETFADAAYMFNAVCCLCKEATVNSYSFILRSKESARVLYTAIADFESSFTDLPELSNNCKSVYIQIDTNENETSSVIKRSFDSMGNVDKTVALERMRLLDSQNEINKEFIFSDGHPNRTDHKLNQDLLHNNAESASGEELQSAEDESLWELTTKIKNVNRLKHFYCVDCKAGFNSLECYEKHRIAKKKCTSRSRGIYRCDICCFVAVYKSLLYRHKRSQHGVPAIICEWCGKSCNSQSELKLHVIKHNDERNFECQECGGKFKSAFTLKNHMTLHTGERNYHCNFCDKSFRNASSRNEHTRRHHVSEPVSCDLCDKVFKVREDFLRHKKKHFSDEKGKFPCSECPHRAYSKKELEQHIRYKHHGEKPFKCEICDKNYGTEKILKIHLNTHMDKIYDCKECGQTFKSLFGIKSHMFQHTGAKPYPCKYCEQSFKDSNRRLEHIRRHHIFEPHECNVCKKVYRTQGDLYRHKKGHAGLKEESKANKTANAPLVSIPADKNLK